MLSICPYPDCRKGFEVEGAQFNLTDRFGGTDCPHCSRPCLARPAELIEQLAAKNTKPELDSSQFDAPQTVASPVLDAGQNQLVVVLDDIRSLHNVGAVFRTADAAGFSHVYLAGITGVPPRKQIAKVSLGAEDWIAFSYFSFLPDIILPLKMQGYSIVALEKNASSKSLYTELTGKKLSLPICLILGNEVQGVSPEALVLADHVCHLSMRGEKESLNASVAFGVAAYFLAEALL